MSLPKKILLVFGTRPEAIKLAPLYFALRQNKALHVSICVTAQHREMLDSILDFFSIVPEFDLNIMSPNQTLFDIVTEGLSKIKSVFDSYKPDLVVVQGDTTTALVGALAAYYQRVPIAHVESGLRTFDKYYPFPEEKNRVLVDHLSDLFFAPTYLALEHLKQENINKNVWMVGNTIVDALKWTYEKMLNTPETTFFSEKGIHFKKPTLVVTCHRRENFGKPFENICKALLTIAQTQACDIVFPVHSNPHIKNSVQGLLGHQSNIFLVPPLDYPEFVWLLSKCTLVLTDSGGIQEEAPTFSKPVLILRDTTERLEGVQAGSARLVGTDTDTIVRHTKDLLENESALKAMASVQNPYGDGKASERIMHLIDTYLTQHEVKRQ